MPLRMILAALVLALGWPALAAAEAGQAVCARLKRLDREITINDQEHLTTFEYRERGRLAKAFKTRVLSRGAHEALVDFLAPGDMRGTRILVADAETMYVYLPQFRRVRRIAGHAMRQPFMGTNIYYEDIVERRFTSRWQCRPQEATAEAWVVELTPLAGVTTAYSKVSLTIDRARDAPVTIEYYESGRHVRTQHREQFQEIGGHQMPTRFRFESHDRDAELTMELSEWRVNIGIPDSVFTRRTLIKGF